MSRPLLLLALLVLVVAAPAADARSAVVKLNADKLPKGLDGRSGPRPPFKAGSPRQKPNRQ